jgi:hypothetical protein
VAKKPHDTHCILFVVVRSYFMKHFENYERAVVYPFRLIDGAPTVFLLRDMFTE